MFHDDPNPLNETQRFSKLFNTIIAKLRNKAIGLLRMRSFLLELATSVHKESSCLRIETCSKCNKEEKSVNIKHCAFVG